MRMHKPGWIILAVTLLLAACANQKEPAEKVIAQAESEISSIREDAAKFAPEALQSVDSTLAGLKEKAAQGDYKSVLAGAPQLTAAVNSLKETVAGKKAEFETQMAGAL
jgi:PBP1b-binding outer membrane lipoprotein LpoB